jgi:predicted 3-demethylubiquinone-9 3-methyltransferase (glyoxalase superfamily)
MHGTAVCLWFDGQAEAAAEFYVGAFRACGREAALGEVMRFGAAGPGPQGSVLSREFSLAGRDYIALNGGPHFRFTPAISLFVECADQAEVDRFWETLSAGGEAGRCGWLTDRFGVSWQIAPSALGRMLRDPDAARADRVMAALLQMGRLDLARLTRAYEEG